MKKLFSTCSAQSRAMMAGYACIIFSRLTPEEINLFKIFRPEAMTLLDEETGEEVFSLDIEEGQPGSLRPDFALFSTVPSADGKATITVLLDPSGHARTELVKKKLGKGLKRLDQLEEQMIALLPEVKRDQEVVLSWFEPQSNM